MNRVRKLLLGATLAATLFSGYARAQSAAPYTHTFPAVPSEASCELDVVGTTSASNAAKVSATTLTNDAIPAAKEYDLGSGKSVRENLGAMFGEERAKVGAVRVESAAPSKASMTCTTRVNVKSTLPDGTETTSTVLSGYTISSVEFNSAEMLILPRLTSPFSNASVWTGHVLAQNASEANGYLELKTQQRNPSATKDNEHFSWQPIARGENRMFTIDDLFPANVRENSANGAMRLVRPDGSRTADLAAYQLVTSQDGGRFALAMSTETASRELHFTHAFESGSTDGIGGWAVGIGLANPNTKPTSVYLTPLDGAGKELGTNVVTLGAGKSIVGLPKDIFAGIPDYKTVASVRVTSKERIHGFALYKHENHLVAVPAATSLDCGTELLAPRTMFDTAGALTSLAIYNPGNRAEPIRASAHDATGKEIAAREFTINARTKTAGAIHDFFPGSDVSSVAYVKFKATQAPKDASVLDAHNLEGRIAGVAINLDWRSGLHITGYKLENIDANRILVETSKFNPRPITGIGFATTTRNVAEVEDTPGEITATVISNQPVTGFVYDFGTGQGFSATMTNERQGRMLHATKKTADGFDYKYFPNQVQGTSVTYMPTIGISTLADGKTQLNTYKTNMTVVDRLPVFNVNALNGPGSARNVTREQAPQIAKILTTERGTILGGTLPLVDKDGNLLMSEQTLSDDLQQKASISGPDSLANIHIIDKKQFNSYILETADGARADIAIPKTASGNDLVQQLKNIYQVGPKWYHQPAEGSMLTLK